MRFVLYQFIPADKQGALETTLLDAISEEEYDKIIVGNVQNLWRMLEL